MRILAPRLREEVWAALPEGVEVRFLDEPWPKACDLFIPPYGQEEVVRRVLEEVEVKVVQTLSAGVDWILPLVPEGWCSATAPGSTTPPWPSGWSWPSSPSSKTSPASSGPKGRALGPEEAFRPGGEEGPPPGLRVHREGGGGKA